MAELLLGLPVSKAIDEKTITLINEKILTPTLAIIRVGNKEDDLAYERTILKKATTLGINIKQIVFEENVLEEDYYQKIIDLNNDDSVDGILLFSPLPKHLNLKKACQLIKPEKDMDGCSDGSLGSIFLNKDFGYNPCTAQAVIEILDYYHYDIEGKNIVVIGRSLVVGKPVSQLLLNRNATVTICHSKTKNIAEITKQADIVIVAIGKMESIDSSYFNENSIVIDVGINFNPIKNKLCGDVDFDTCENFVQAITPVPKGVGSVTTSILLNHVALANSKNK